VQRLCQLQQASSSDCLQCVWQASPQDTAPFVSACNHSGLTLGWCGVAGVELYDQLLVAVEPHVLVNQPLNASKCSSTLAGQQAETPGSAELVYAARAVLYCLCCARWQNWTSKLV
jgi:hypothetical protein